MNNTPQKDPYPQLDQIHSQNQSPNQQQYPNINQNLQQQFHQIVQPGPVSQIVQSNYLGNPMLGSVPQSQSKIDELRYHQERNKSDLSSSVRDLNGFYKEKMEGYTFDYRKSDHPTAALFHFAVKAFAVAFYMFGGIFIREAWTIPEIIIVIGAIDFWITKNVTGRLLVGLRWWEEIDEASGQQLWVFETRVNENTVSKVNEGIFWVTMALAVLAWGFLGFINILTINVLNMIGISFQFIIQSINFYFYFQCSRIAKQRAKQLAKVLGAEMINKMMNQSVIWPMKLPKQK